jgi:hypothetical protein
MECAMAQFMAQIDPDGSGNKRTKDEKIPSVFKALGGVF